MADITESRAPPDYVGPSPTKLGLVGIFTEGGRARLPEPKAMNAKCRIGRDESTELQLDDSQVSREHAIVEPAPDGVWVTDLGSRNGTWVDGWRVEAPQKLASVGATIRCGKTLLAVVRDLELFEMAPVSGSPTLIGGARLAEIRRSINSIGLLPHAVLVLGETGTGKERVAEALHAASLRKGAFVPVNCSAIPSNLIESELFGHVRGAFSGSDRARPGIFRAGEGGTVFLDEIGDLPLTAQAKLLRVLETGEVRAVGEDQPRIVDVRIVAATNANLDQMVSSQRFRADLLHRISTWKIVLPPLRDRFEDVPLLAEHFVPEGNTFSVEAMERLVLWGWPGNVRELRGAVQTAGARAEAAGARQILPPHLPPEIVQSQPHRITEPNPDAVMRTRLETALGLRKGNVAQVARDLGFGRPWLYQELKRLGIDPEAFRKR